MDQRLVEVIATQVGVAVCREHLHHLVAHLEHRDVKRPAAQVEHDDLLVLFLLQAVGECRRGRLVDDPVDFQPGDLAGVLGGLALGVVEVRRDRDDRPVHLVPQVALGGFLQLAEHVSRDLLRGELLVPQLDLDVFGRPPGDLVGDHLLFAGDLRVPAAHEPLDRVDGSPGVRHRLPLGRISHEHISLVGEGDDAGCQAIAFEVGDDLRLTPLHDRDHGVGGPQVDSDDCFSASSHEGPPPRFQGFPRCGFADRRAEFDPPTLAGHQVASSAT